MKQQDLVQQHFATLINEALLNMIKSNRKILDNDDIEVAKINLNLVKTDKNS